MDNNILDLIDSILGKEQDSQHIISENFNMLKKAYRVDNKYLSKKLNIDENILKMIDENEAVSFDILEKIAGFFGVYVSDLLIENAIKPVAGAFFKYDKNAQLSVEDRKFELKDKEKLNYYDKRFDIIFKYENELKEIAKEIQFKDSFVNFINEVYKYITNDVFKTVELNRLEKQLQNQSVFDFLNNQFLKGG